MGMSSCKMTAATKRKPLPRGGPAIGGGITKKTNRKPPPVQRVSSGSGHEILLTDDDMFAYFRKSPSVQHRCDVLRRALESHGMSAVTTASVVREVFDELLVPPGVKAYTRGMLFNQIVQTELTDVLCDCQERFVLSFERPLPIVAEIPDWTLVDAITGRVLIGMNQIDVWSGGHQLNRAGKYVLDDRLHERLRDEHDARMIAVVAHELPDRTRRGSKVDRLRRHIIPWQAPATARMCWPRDLEAVVTSWMEDCAAEMGAQLSPSTKNDDLVESRAGRTQ